jgi:hypothetical protein
MVGKIDLRSKQGVKNNMGAYNHCFWRYSGHKNSDRLFTVSEMFRPAGQHEHL